MGNEQQADSYVWFLAAILSDGFARKLVARLRLDLAQAKKNTLSIKARLISAKQVVAIQENQLKRPPIRSGWTPERRAAQAERARQLHARRREAKKNDGER